MTPGDPLTIERMFCYDSIEAREGPERIGLALLRGRQSALAYEVAQPFQNAAAVVEWGGSGR